MRVFHNSYQLSTSLYLVPMEKIIDPIRIKLPPLRLYLDQLREVYDVLSIHCDKPIIIQTCGYRITDLDELENLPDEQTNELYISSNIPNLQIKLAQNYGEIYSSESSLEVEGLLSRIEKILLHGKTRYPISPFNNWLPFLFGLSLCLGIIFRYQNFVIISIIILLVNFLWAILDFNFVNKPVNTIIFKSRKDSPNFWKRNKDDILKLVLGIIIGSFITKYIDYLIK